jgi:hypothetical protein
VKHEKQLERDETGRFLTGNNGGGRPRGARSKLSERFLNALQADFEQHGPDVIAKVRIEKPDVYLKVVANLMPARLEAQLEAKVEHHHVGEFGDANSIPEILELVAREAGHEAARTLAAMFGIEFSGDQTLLPPKKAEEICPYPEGTANHRSWYHRRYGGFPD